MEFHICSTHNSFVFMVAVPWQFVGVALLWERCAKITYSILGYCSLFIVPGFIVRSLLVMILNSHLQTTFCIATRIYLIA